MAKGVKVHGVAERVIDSIKPGLNEQLVVHKLARLRCMIKTEAMVWAALESYGKAGIVQKAIKANGGSLVSTSRR